MSIFFRKKYKQHTTNKKINSKNLKYENIIHQNFYHIANGKCVQKITRDSSPTNLECKARGFMTESNNVCKTIRQEIYTVYYNIKC